MKRNPAATAVVLVIFTRFLIFAQRMVVAPFFYRLMERFGVGYLEMGALLTMFFVGYATMQLPAGLAADRYQARHVITLGLGVLGMGSLVFIYAPTLFWALAGRLVMGVGAALCYAPGMKLVAANTTFHERGRAIGLVQASAAAASLCTLMVFPILGVWVGIDSLFLSLTVFSPVLMIAYLVIRPKSKPAVAEKARRPETTTRTSATTGRRPVVPAWRNLASLMVVGFLGLFAANSLNGWLPTYLNGPLGFGESGAGVVMGAMLVANMISSYSAGRFSDMMGRRTTAASIGTVVTVAGLALVMLHPGKWLIYPVVIVLGLGAGSMIAPIVVVAAEIFGTERAGFVISAMNTVGQIGSAVGGVLFGYIADATGGFTTVWAAGAIALVIRIAMIFTIDERASTEQASAHVSV